MTAEMGKVASPWRYPVKSMQGEELSEAEITQSGLLGDRVYALIDVAEGKAASAKKPGEVADPLRVHGLVRRAAQESRSSSGRSHDAP